MADYFPLLARAIGGLPNKTGDARTVIYERARKALLAQLRNADPPLRDDDIAREQASLEEAIRRLEADYIEPEPIVAPPVPVDDEPQAIAEQADEAALREERAGFEPHEDEPEAPAAVPPVEPSTRVAPAASRPRHDEADPYDDLMAVAATPRTARFAAPDDAGEPDLMVEREPRSFDDQGPRTKRGRLIALVVLIVVLVAASVVGIIKRDSLIAMVNGTQDTASSTPARTPTSTVAPEAPKSTDRIAQAAPESGQRAPAASGQSQSNGGATASQTLGVAERAVLFEESAGGGSQGLQQFVGSVVWSTDTFSPGAGQEPDIGIQAVIDIPDRGIKATLRLRRNKDSSIPASHIIEVQFELPPNFDLGNVANVPGMRAKASEGAQGAPLTGLAVRVAPGYFLIGLSAIDVERQRNMGLLITRNWVDLPIVFDNGRRAILVLEKGLPGDQAFRQTFLAWGLPVPSTNQQQP